MTRLGPLLVGLLLATAGLSGCLGFSDDGSDGVEPTNQTSETAQPQATSSPGDPTTQGADAGDGFEPLRFEDQPPVNTTLWANGTFSAHEGCFPAGCRTGTAYQSVELSGELPEASPAVVTAELSYSSGANPIPLDSMDVFISSEDATFYDYDFSDGEGQTTSQATVLKGSEPVLVQVIYHGPSGEVPEAPYTLRIDVASLDTTLEPGVPVAVSAEPGQTLAVQPAGEGDSEGAPTLWAYGPDDTFLGELGGEGGAFQATIPGNSSSGEHVLVVPEDSPPVTIETNGTDTSMQALGLSFESGDPHEIQGTEPVTWSFDLSQRPLAVGMYYSLSQPAGASVQEGLATVAGPEGAVFEGDLGCNVCLFIGSYVEGQISDVGVDGLAAGTYEAAYESGGEVGFSVGYLAMTYERGG